MYHHNLIFTFFSYICFQINYFPNLGLWYPSYHGNKDNFNILYTIYRCKLHEKHESIKLI